MKRLLIAAAALVALLIPAHAASAATTLDKNASWSGWAVTGSHTSASGDVVVPRLDCNLYPNSMGAAWVGLDGQYASEAEEVGIVFSCAHGLPFVGGFRQNVAPGQTTEFALPLTLAQGDTVRLTVAWGGGSTYVETARNLTRGGVFSTATTAPFGQHGSAECITEQTPGVPYPAVNGVVWGNCVANGTFAIPGYGNVQDVIVRHGLVRSDNPRFTQHSYYTTVAAGVS